MRAARAISLTLCFAFGFVACSSGGGGGAFFDGGPLGEQDSASATDAKGRDSRVTPDAEEELEASVRPQDSSAADTKKSDGPNVCVSVCSTDPDCQASCPPAPFGGVNCCDFGTGVCYAASSGSCGSTDGGID